MKVTTMNGSQLIAECNKILVSMGKMPLTEFYTRNPLINAGVLRLVLRDCKRDLKAFKQAGNKVIK